MASASITTRTTGKGEKRYVVRFRLGGAAYPIQHAGSFKAMKDAKTRRDVVAGELAAGRNPAGLLNAMLAGPPKRKTIREWTIAYAASRIDHAASTAGKLPSRLAAIDKAFGDKDPFVITFEDVQAWINELVEKGRKPGTIDNYLGTLRLVLDYAGVEKNPARDRRVKVPTAIHEEVNPPTGPQFLAMLDKMTNWHLAAVTMEQTGMAIGETCQLEWGDVDVAENRFRLRRSTVKGQIRARARIVQVPEWVMDVIGVTCPLEDRTAERRVFIGLTGSAIRNVMRRACVAAGIPTFSPHDLRHRRATIWHHDGVVAKQLAERLGHSRASMSLDVYSHTMRLEECQPDALQAALRP
jgi:integrase